MVKLLAYIPSLLLFLLGILAPNVGLVEPEYPLFLITFYLLFTYREWNILSWYTPLLLLFFTWGAAEFAVYEEMTAALSAWYWGALLLLADQISESEERRDSLSRGLLLGMIPALLITTVNIVSPDLLTLKNEIPYWISHGREAGTLQDPNSLGLFAFLACVFLCSKKTLFGHALFEKRIAALFAIWWIGIGLYSGSRAFFLASTLYLLVLVSIYKRKAFFGLLALVALGLCVVNFWPQSMYSLPLPITIERALQSLEFSEIPQTFSTRILFSRIATSLYIDYPVLGIGPTFFSTLVPAYADKLGIQTGLWTDNANNFYLQILVELGVVGLICALYACAQWIKRTKITSRCLEAGLLAFAAVLVVGPHLLFIEVALLFLLLFVSCFQKKESSSHIPLILVLPFCFYLPLYISRIDHGWYNWEQEGDSYFRWSRRKAFSHIRCDLNHTATLKVRSLAPIEENIVFLNTPYEKNLQIQLQPGAAREIPLSCKKETAVSSLPFSLRVRTTWSPHLTAKDSKDTRDLGVQVFWETPSDALPSQ